MVARARQAVKLDGGHIEGHGALAVGLYNLGKKAIFESNRDGLSEAQRSARRRSAENYFTQANETADALLALDPNSSIGLNIKGWALTQMGRQAEGRQAVDAAQQSEATADAPDTPRNVSDVIADAEESVQFLEDAKTQIEVEQQPDGSFSVRHPYLDDNGEPIEASGQYAVGSTEEEVRQTAIDMIDRKIAEHREVGEQAGEAPETLEVPDTDTPTRQAEINIPEEADPAQVRIALEGIERELNNVIAEIDSINQMDFRTREGDLEQQKLGDREAQRDRLQERLTEVQRQLEYSELEPDQRIERRLQEIQARLDEINAHDINDLLRREREGEPGLVGQLGGERYKLEGEHDALNQQHQTCLLYTSPSPRDS